MLAKVLSAAFLATVTALPAAAAEDPILPQTRVFDASVDGRELGRHRFELSGSPDDFRVRSVADFRVGVAFVTLFRYEHEAREHWVDGCMVSLESTTNDDGTRRQVSGEAVESGFSIETGEGGLTLDQDCAWGFAYWHPELREHTELINPQDGRLFEVEWTELGEQTLEVAGTTLETRAWALRNHELDITIHYDAEGRWAGLDTVRGERTVRYRPAPGDPLHPGE
ncbi:MAG: DUF6134 family protein [Gammaproteobacteria bacterium]|nr:DUF6134 family protein [Gammaproteobacteria bacterium]